MKSSQLSKTFLETYFNLLIVLEYYGLRKLKLRDLESDTVNVTCLCGEGDIVTKFPILRKVAYQEE